MLQVSKGWKSGQWLFQSHQLGMIGENNVCMCDLARRGVWWFMCLYMMLCKYVAHACVYIYYVHMCDVYMRVFAYYVQMCMCDLCLYTMYLLFVDVNGCDLCIVWVCMHVTCLWMYDVHVCDCACNVICTLCVDCMDVICTLCVINASCDVCIVCCFTCVIYVLRYMCKVCGVCIHMDVHGYLCSMYMYVCSTCMHDCTGWSMAQQDDQERPSHSIWWVQTSLADSTQPRDSKSRLALPLRNCDPGQSL